MRIEHPFARAVSLVIASLLIAVVANGFAGRTRQLKLPGWYPHALRVPPKEQPAPKPIAVAPVTTTTTTVVQTPVAVPVRTATTTIAQTTTQQPGNPATQQPVTPPPAPQKPDLSKFTPHPDKPYVEITGDDAAALFSAGVLFLDARRSSIFEEGHIAGARSFSIWEA